MADYEKYGLKSEIEIILRIAEALRDEFGVGIDAHPGGVGSEAGVVNRAFRASARCILGMIEPRIEDVEGVLTWVLRQAALRRLTEIGLVAPVAEGLLDMELGLGDSWLVYMAMASREVVGTLPGGGPAADALLPEFGVDVEFIRLLLPLDRLASTVRVAIGAWTRRTSEPDQIVARSLSTQVLAINQLESGR